LPKLNARIFKDENNINAMFLNIWCKLQDEHGTFLVYTLHADVIRIKVWMVLVKNHILLQSESAN